MMHIFIQTGLSVAHDWPSIDSSYQIESSKTGALLLSEQRREKYTFLNALTVIWIRTVHRGRECPLGGVRGVYTEQF
jgi:hypothetical protein